MTTHVIIGAGQAGGQAARTMRDKGFTGDIIIVGEEPHPPHQRPPLSKAVLQGKTPPERTHLYKAEWYEEHNVTLKLSTTATAIDAEVHTVELDSGETLQYDKLLLATGATLRRLGIPGIENEGVFYLRRIEDTLAIQPRLQSGARVIVIGGGFIGLEVASSACEAGCEVTVLEATDRLMGRSMDPWMGEWYQRLHNDRGVAIHLNAAASSIDAGGQELSVVTDVGVFAGDTVVVGIGIVPNDALARQIGAEVDNGVVVDATGRTSVADVYACGDVACHYNSRFGARLRLESWENAQNQAIAAATSMCGEAASYDPAPWFWTNQYDINMQIAGVAPSWDERVIRGHPDSGKFLVFYLAEGKLVACSAANSAREMRSSRTLLEHGATIPAATLRDEATDLKALAAEIGT